MAKRGYRGITDLENLSAQEIKERNVSLYGAKIREYRIKAGMRVEELAEKLNVTRSSIRNWESGFSRPDLEYLCRMFSILDVEPNIFFGLCGVGSLLTGPEKALLEDYRALDSAGQEDLTACAAALREKSERRTLQSALKRMQQIPYRYRQAAAGEGLDWEEYQEPEQVLVYTGPQTTRADEIFHIVGNSMEPLYEDGDQVLVEYCSSLRYGEIGIFYIPGRGGFIKQVACDRLHSLNPDYDDVFPYEDGARVIGRVLGKLTGDMIPGREEQKLYERAVRHFSE